jgi:hypothetical protein
VTLDVRLRAFLFALWIVSLQQFAHAGTGIIELHGETPRLTIHGRLVATEEEADDCVFHLDTVTITAPEQYTCDWLAGSNGYRLVMTITPEP